MSVIIGQASKNEFGRVSGGSRGDQTGAEVKLSDWYDGDWHTVLRPVNGAVALKSAAACKAACLNENIGYSQSHRNTLNQVASRNGYDLAGVKTPCDCDCSSLMHVCAIAGGAPLVYGMNGFVTSNMVRTLTNSGAYVALQGAEYTESSKLLRPGDILVTSGHTAMVVETSFQSVPDTDSSESKAEMKSAMVLVVAFIVICLSVLFGVSFALFHA